MGSSTSRRIAQVATSQHGPISRGQLIEAGLRSSAVDRRAHAGELHRIYRGVYLVGHEALAPLARETAALLACGDGAVLSHFSAASLWSLGAPQPADAELHVTLVGRRRRSRPGLRVHRTGGLQDADICLLGRLPLTSPARTVLDVAGEVEREDLERMFAQAQVLRLLRPEDLAAAMARAGPRPGVLAVRALLRREGDRGFTRSEAERRLVTLTREAGLPPPWANVRVQGYEVDFLWEVQRLVVEVDGYAFHAHRGAFESDRKRDAALVSAGYRVIRVTWRQLLARPLAVVANLARALGAPAAGERDGHG